MQLYQLLRVCVSLKRQPGGAVGEGGGGQCRALVALTLLQSSEKWTTEY